MKMQTGFKHIIIILAAVVLAALMISSCARQDDKVNREDDDDVSASVGTDADGDSNTQDTTDSNDSNPKENPSDDGDPRNTDDTPEPSTPEPSTPEPGSPEPSTPEPGTPEPSTPDPGTLDPGEGGSSDENGSLTGDDNIDALEVRIGQTVFRLDILLSYDDVKGLDADELAALRNSFYASRGYIFKNKKFTDMFSEYNWYKPEHDDVEDLLSDRDKMNINLILKIEGKYGALYDVFSQEETPLLGFWQHDIPYAASGFTRTYVFNDDRSVEFRENEMDGEERIRALYGSWYVINGKLCMCFTARDVIIGGELEPATGSIGTDYEIVGGSLVSGDLEDPIIEMHELNFDQDNLEYSEDRFGVMIGGEEYYYLSAERY